MICKNKLLFLLFIPSLLLAKGYVCGELQGQLGNQMFIVAATYSLAKENNAIPVFPDFLTKNMYNLSKNFEEFFFRCNVINPKIKFQKIYVEPFFHYKKIPYTKNMILRGYFQSEKYFSNYKGDIIKLFAPSEKIKTYIQDKYSRLLENENTVAIHIRNYLKEDPNGLYHPNCTLAYYCNALKQVPENAKLVVFTNDLRYAKELLQNRSGIFEFIENESYIVDFYLMSMCKNTIISNSSFSWWAAYLNSNKEKIVVAPKRWFNSNYIKDVDDIFPDDWIVLDGN